jgi:hypothetical protein
MQMTPNVRGLVGAALVIGAVGGGVVTTAATASAADIGPCTGRAQPDRNDWAAPGKLFVGKVHFENRTINVSARLSVGAQRVFWHGETAGLDGWADTNDIAWSNWDRMSFQVPMKTGWGSGKATVVMMPQACDQETGQVLDVYSEVHIVGNFGVVAAYKTNTGQPLTLIDG